MAAITIGPSGADFTQPNSSAYAALAGGGVLNTVTWDAGFVYTPTAGRWWGLDRRRGVPKRIQHIINGYTGSAATRVWADARYYFGAGGTDGTHVGGTVIDSVTIADGVWLIEVPTSGIPAAPVVELFVGATAGSTPGAIGRGTRYRQADSLAQCNADGAALAGMRDGDGIWWAQQKTGATTTLQLFIWCPLTSGTYPAAQWQGLAITFSTSGAGNAGSPNYSPWLFERDGSNTPDGSIVEAGFSSIGVALHHFGSVDEGAAVGALPWEDVQYSDVEGYGGRALAVVGSLAVGTTVTNVNGTGLYYSQLSDPATHPSNGTDPQSNEIITYRERTKTCVWQTGVLDLANSHAALNIGQSPTNDAEERITASRISGIEVRFRGGAQDARGLSTGNCDDAIVDRCLFTGCTTRGHWGGNRTIIHSNEWKLQQIAQNEAEESRSVCDVRRDLDDAAATVLVRAYSNIIDRRGDVSRGITEPWGCLEIRGTDTFDAGGLELRDTVLLVDNSAAICVPIWVSVSAGVNANQTIIGVMHNGATEVMSGAGTGTTPSGGTTFAGYFSTGTVSKITQDLTGEILSRGDRPANRWGELALGAVV